MHPNPYNNLLVKQSLVPAARTASADGTAVDRAEDSSMFQDALVVVACGTITDGTHTIEVQDSPDNSDWTAVADEFLQGTEPAIAAANDDATFEIGYLGDQRYLRVIVTAAGTTTGGVYGAAVILSNPRRAPVVRN
jgi:hypothetical protein